MASPPVAMAKKTTFEDALDKLEEIAVELEDGDLSLDAALKKFDEGVKMAALCNEKLADAQQKVDLLLKKGGALSAVPFQPRNDESDQK